MTKNLLLVSLLMGCGLAAAHAADAAKIDVSKLPPAASKAGVTFTTDIKPIFDKSCVRCHGVEKPKARLRLDSLDSVLKGGEHGKVVAAGKSAESKLVHGVAHLTHEDYFMPPPGNRAGIPKLTAEQVGLIRAWIDQGAK